MKLKIYVQPGAKKSDIVGEHSDYIKIKIHSPPVDGKANEALIYFLSKTLSVPKSAISIVAGEKSRFKTVSIENIDAETELKIKQILFQA